MDEALVWGEELSRRSRGVATAALKRRGSRRGRWRRPWSSATRHGFYRRARTHAGVWMGASGLRLTWEPPAIEVLRVRRSRGRVMRKEGRKERRNNVARRSNERGSL